MEKVARRRALAAQVVSTRERSVLDAETVRQVGGRPVPLLNVVFPAAFLGIGGNAVQEQADFQLRLLPKELRIQGEGLEPELLPRLVAGTQGVSGIHGVALVRTLVPGAARFDLDESNARPLLLGIAGDVLGDLGEEAVVIRFVFG